MRIGLIRKKRACSEQKHNLHYKSKRIPPSGAAKVKQNTLETRS